MVFELSVYLPYTTAHFNKFGYIEGHIPPSELQFHMGQLMVLPTKCVPLVCLSTSASRSADTGTYSSGVLNIMPKH